jgi:hypothetical protein
MSKFLYDVQQKNRLEQKGLLKRFSITCFGHQESQEEMRAEKAKKYNEFKNNRNSPEYNKWFLNYSPNDMKENSFSKKNVYKKKFSKNLKKQKKNYLFNPYNKTRKNYYINPIK